ncbi:MULTISPECIES: LCP family protein [Actinomadura]|uniref:Cell envelope-related function transcriptional attenuator common domain-containing protein n=1 Tax=Actinomadura madurae TaxID=1993 RepID=A0A1I5ELP1_9ACTN|nr:LCP family protein [Actinomadura madurae]SFO12434.1 cell envelope-related function transcriptional attenuator common domain-containing protein [Actinomadura madurae]SPT59998.1 Regulatory protein msrR [Actinomadura madurae]
MTSPDLSGSQASERPEAAPGAQATEAPPVPGSDAENAFWGGGDGTETARKRRWPRILIAVGVFLALIVAGLGGLVWQRQSSYNGNIDRIKGVMPDDGSKRPGPNVAGTENWLLVGSDSRAEATTGEGNQVWKPGQQRTDTIMLLHLPADRKKAYIISFPRDSWVEIPGYGRQKINAAFSFGGPKLLIETMESLTGIRVDHFGAIDFEGFKSMTDALGGVTVNIKQSVYDPARKKQWEAGRQKLDGEEALLFVRQRYNLPNGDFDRIKRQQAFLGALAKQAADRGTLTNPLKLDRFLSALTKSISVDEGVSAGDLRSLALSMRSVRASDVMFMTLPNKGTGMRAKQSVVFLDGTKAKALFDAVKSARMAEYVKQHGAGNSLGTVS